MAKKAVVKRETLFDDSKNYIIVAATIALVVYMKNRRGETELFGGLTTSDLSQDAKAELTIGLILLGLGVWLAR